MLSHGHYDHFPPVPHPQGRKARRSTGADALDDPEALSRCRAVDGWHL